MRATHRSSSTQSGPATTEVVTKTEDAVTDAVELLIRRGAERVSHIVICIDFPAQSECGSATAEVVTKTEDAVTDAVELLGR